LLFFILYEAGVKTLLLFNSLAISLAVFPSIISLKILITFFDASSSIINLCLSFGFF